MLQWRSLPKVRITEMISFATALQAGQEAPAAESASHLRGDPGINTCKTGAETVDCLL